MFPRYREAIRTYETAALREIVSLVASQLKPHRTSSVLDISNDLGIFTSLLCERIGVKNAVHACRESHDNADLNWMKSSVVNLTNKDEMLASLGRLGSFDLIVVNNVLDEVKSHLSQFLEALKLLLASDKGVIVVLFRGKNPPPPLPPVTLNTWLDVSFGRQEVLNGVFQAGLLFDCYSVSCPLKLDRQLWSKILKSRCIPSVRNCYSCNNRVIDKFISSQDIKIQFEEKHFVLICVPEPE